MALFSFSFSFDSRNNTISDEKMAGIRRRAVKAHPEKARFDTSKEAVQARLAENRRHEQRHSN